MLERFITSRGKGAISHFIFVLCFFNTLDCCSQERNEPHSLCSSLGSEALPGRVDTRARGAVSWRPLSHACNTIRPNLQLLILLIPLVTLFDTFFFLLLTLVSLPLSIKFGINLIILIWGSCDKSRHVLVMLLSLGAVHQLPNSLEEVGAQKLST